MSAPLFRWRFPNPAPTAGLMFQHAFLRILAIVLLTTAIIPAVPAAPAVPVASPAPAAPNESFTPLFNGRNLEGWVNVNCAPETWQTSGSVIHCTGFPIGMLRTERMYRNFILEVEWRHLKPEGNAGVFVWADPLPARGQPFVRGIEVQVLDGREGDWFTSDGDIFPVHGARMVPENGRGGDRAFPTEKRVRPSPEWNHYRIHCQDGAISLTVNGKEVTRGHSALPRKGYICLESEGSPAEFRNIRIRELPEGDALPPDQIASPAEGFRPLYNGLNLDGWTTAPETAKHWKTSDWILESDGGGGEGSSSSSLVSQEGFGDVQLIVDWRWAGSPAAGASSAIALRGGGETQLLLSLSPGGSGKPYLGRADASSSEPLRMEPDSPKPADRPAGEWNRFLIILRGNQLDVALNGEPIVTGAQLPKIPGRGRLSLGHGGAPVQFANILVRELD